MKCLVVAVCWGMDPFCCQGHNITLFKCHSRVEHILYANISVMAGPAHHDDDTTTGFPGSDRSDFSGMRTAPRSLRLSQNEMFLGGTHSL